MAVYEGLSGQVLFTPFRHFVVMRKVVNGERPAEAWRGCGSRMTCGECSIGVGRLDRRAPPAVQLSWGVWSGFRGIRNRPRLWRRARIRRILRNVFPEYFHCSIFVVPSHYRVGSLGPGVLIHISSQYTNSFSVYSPLDVLHMYNFIRKLVGCLHLYLG